MLVLVLVPLAPAARRIQLRPPRALDRDPALPRWRLPHAEPPPRLALLGRAPAQRPPPPRVLGRRRRAHGLEVRLGVAPGAAAAGQARALRGWGVGGRGGGGALHELVGC